jgi:hypothetical protein
VPYSVGPTGGLLHARIMPTPMTEPGSANGTMPMPSSSLAPRTFALTLR